MNVVFNQGRTSSNKIFSIRRHVERLGIQNEYILFVYISYDSSHNIVVGINQVFDDRVWIPKENDKSDEITVNHSERVFVGHDLCSLFQSFVKGMCFPSFFLVYCWKKCLTNRKFIFTHQSTAGIIIRNVQMKVIFLIKMKAVYANYTEDWRIG